MISLIRPDTFTFLTYAYDSFVEYTISTTIEGPEISAYVYYSYLGSPEITRSTTNTCTWDAYNYTYNISREPTKHPYPEPGRHYYGYRYYSPSMGRWLSRDPIGEEGGSCIYQFVFNNPLKYIDRFGSEPIPADGKSDQSTKNQDDENFPCEKKSYLSHRHRACCASFSPIGGTPLEWQKLLKMKGALPYIVPEKSRLPIGSEIIVGLGIADGGTCYGANLLIYECKKKSPKEISDPKCPSGKRYLWIYKLRISIEDVSCISRKCCEDYYNKINVDQTEKQLRDCTPKEKKFDTSEFAVKGECVK